MITEQIIHNPFILPIQYNNLMAIIKLLFGYYLRKQLQIFKSLRRNEEKI